MKHQDLKKKLIRESLITLGALIVLGAGVYFLVMLSEDYAREGQTLESQALAVNAEVSSLRSKFTKVKDNGSLYQEIMQKHASDRLASICGAAGGEFDKLYKAYTLSIPEFKISPLQNWPERNKLASEMDLTKHSVIACDVPLVFSALTDEDVYRVLHTFSGRDFPGVVRVTKFGVVRKERVSEQALAEIVKTGKYDMVSTSIYFTWLGLKPADPTAAAENAPVADAPKRSGPFGGGALPVPVRRKP